MSGSLLFTDKDDKYNIDTSSHQILQSTEHTKEEEEKHEEKINIVSRNSTLTSHNVYLYYQKNLIFNLKIFFIIFSQF